MANTIIIKMAVIAVLVVLLLIPLAMIENVVRDRSYHKDIAESDIAESWTGSQILAGPILSIPYEMEYEEEVWDKNLEKMIVQKKTQWRTVYQGPRTFGLSGDIATQKRWRGIYGVPVYTGGFELAGRFELPAKESLQKTIDGFLRWGEPVLAIHIKDVRGVGTNPLVTLNGRTATFVPGAGLTSLSSGVHVELDKDKLWQAPTDFHIQLDLRGSRTLMFAPTATNTSITVKSPWPHPKFTGRFLPQSHVIESTGFEANWEVSSFSNSVDQNLVRCANGDCQSLLHNGFGVALIDSVDVYQNVTRATKYGVLLILLSFVAFFLAETLMKAALHPVQYGLVGFALTVFYLLLLSLSEHLSFAVSYGIASTACIGLLAFYIQGVFGRTMHTLSYVLALALLYATMFIILRAEDFALLMGSFLIFLVLSLVMGITRRIDWYTLSARTADEV